MVPHVCLADRGGTRITCPFTEGWYACQPHSLVLCPGSSVPLIVLPAGWSLSCRQRKGGGIRVSKKWFPQGHWSQDWYAGPALDECSFKVCNAVPVGPGTLWAVPLARLTLLWAQGIMFHIRSACTRHPAEGDARPPSLQGHLPESGLCFCVFNNEDPFLCSWCPSWALGQPCQ